MTDTLTRPVDSYRRPAWNEAVSQALPPKLQFKSTPRWVARVPLMTLLVLLAVLSLRLSNTAFIDEALYINAGHDYLTHWLTGDGVEAYGDSFSGVPFIYPVLAAVLETLGGLLLVRGFSLLCVLAATIFVYRALADLGYRREGMLAAAFFALTGPVVFAGALATFDALVIALLAAALWTGVQKGWTSAMATGVILGLVPIMKYTGAIFIPVVLGVVFLTSPRWRALPAGVIATAIPWAAWLAWSDQIAAGIAFTTTHRTALSPYSMDDLAAWMVLDIGILILIAVGGGLLLARRGPGHALLGLGLLGGGMALPAAQLILGEAVSFDKHMAYSALFLAPLAGYALAQLSRRTWKLLPVAVLLLTALLFGVSRSEAMYSSWVSVQPVLQVIEDNPRPGIYISSATDSLKYHLRDHPEITWETTFSLYPQGNDLIRVAVEDQRFQSVILRSAGTGAPDQDAGQAVLLQALRDNPNYELTATMPAREHSETDFWLVFTKKEA
ncbi:MULTISPECIES: glycosyltransferase family 39 protein [unclassified Arthrobacter]|uniref:ArnT family glycosyltransferase n=1 Tax=unclassified Arthrobacter TaxID=235627 RepID=UPI0033908742